MAICIVCSQGGTLMEFDSPRELNEHIRSGHKTRPKGWEPRPKRITLEQAQKKKDKKSTAPKPKEKKKPKAKPKPEPITLHYIYKGECTECGQEVDTIMMEVGKGLRAVAYCVTCKKKLEEKKVTALK